MKLNNIEMGEFDIYDFENAEKLEKAIELLNDMENLEGLTISEQIKIQCTIVFNFFNTIYGEGTDKKIFGNKVNLMTCIKALGDFLQYTNNQKNEINKISSKYSLDRIKK